MSWSTGKSIHGPQRSSAATTSTESTAASDPSYRLPLLSYGGFQPFCASTRGPPIDVLKGMSVNATSESELRRSWRRLFGKPAPRLHQPWTGAALALASITALATGWATADQTQPGFTQILLRSLCADLMLALVVALLLTGLLQLTVGRFARLPLAFFATLLASVFILGTRGAGASVTGWYLAVAVLVVGSTLLGAGVGWLFATRRDRDRSVTAAAAFAVSGLLVLTVPGAWLAVAGASAPGSFGSRTAVSPDTAAEEAQSLDPTVRGPRSVETLTYGSGTDTRERYGSGVDLRTISVDATAIIGGWDEQRSAHWGFGAQDLPINGRAWLPVGGEPAPLIVIVHGNTSSVDASEDGFEYLADHLASNGFVVAAIDENFLNTSALDRSGGLTGADATRGRLILEHLRTWRHWAVDPDSPLRGRVDIDRIGLIGHSRGGEAIATATRLNGQQPEHERFQIDALFAIAPTDGLYRPDDEPTSLVDVNYMVLQGAQDSDVIGFGGLNQFTRTSFSGESERFKALVYAEGINHTRFNTRWGTYDVGYGLPKHFIDTGLLLPAAQQQRLAQGYANAFLRASLTGDAAARALLEDYQANAHWLPETNYASRYAAAGAATLDAEFTGFTSNTLVALPLRTGPGDELVRRLTWSDDGTQPTIIVPLPDDLGPGGVTIAVDLVGVTAPVVIEAHLTSPTGIDSPPVDRTEVPAQLNSTYLKAAWLQPVPASQPVPQTLLLRLDGPTVRAAQSRAATSVTLAIQRDTRSGEMFFGGVRTLR